jgi:Flp pilus assembly pilin Flp
MYSRAMAAWIGRRRAQDGQDLLEYGLLTSLIASSIVSALAVAGGQISDLWIRIAGGV